MSLSYEELAGLYAAHVKRIAELERKIDGWKHFDCCRDAQRTYDVEKQRDRLRAALEKYGTHKPGCGKWDRMDNGGLFLRSDWQCTCGLTKALEAGDE